jgi:hypothetical protein
MTVGAGKKSTLIRIEWNLDNTVEVYHAYGYVNDDSISFMALGNDSNDEDRDEVRIAELNYSFKLAVARNQGK